MTHFPVKIAPQHVEEALAKLAQQFHDKPNLAALLTTFVDEVQWLEDALIVFEDLRNLDTASDAQLDGAGSIVGEERQGRDDTSYRAAIRARILLNTASGTPEDIIGLVLAILGEVEVELFEFYPAHFDIVVNDPITPDPPAWAPSTAYVVGDKRSNFGNAYVVTTAGTSGTTGPSGIGSGIVDGTVTWAYTGPGIGGRMATIVLSGKPAGVRGIVQWHEDATPFAFYGDPEGAGFGVGAFAGARDF